MVNELNDGVCLRRQTTRRSHGAIESHSSHNPNEHLALVRHTHAHAHDDESRSEQVRHAAHAAHCASNGRATRRWDSVRHLVDRGGSTTFLRPCNSFERSHLFCPSCFVCASVCSVYAALGAAVSGRRAQDSDDSAMSDALDLLRPALTPSPGSTVPHSTAHTGSNGSTAHTGSNGSTAHTGSNGSTTHTGSNGSTSASPNSATSASPTPFGSGSNTTPAFSRPGPGETRVAAQVRTRTHAYARFAALCDASMLC